MRKTHEDVPLEPTKDGTSDTYVVNQVPKGMALYTKKKLLLVAIAIILLLLILLVVVIVLAVLLSNAKSDTPHKGKREDDASGGGSVEREGGDKITTTPAPTPTPIPGPWESNVRLPRSISPTHYNLHMDVDPNKDGFSGHETIDIDISEDNTKHILVHSSGLNITEAKVSYKDQSVIPVKRHFDSTKNSFHVIETQDALSKGSYKLRLKFSGAYGTGLVGLFKGEYKKQDGKMATFLSTQLEPIYGRTMFPCFDEPALKAMFKISLTYPKDMVGLSNNEVEKELTKDDMKTTTYKPSPKMSAYLVSVVVGHFEHKQLTTSSGVTLRAFAQPGNTDQMDFALKMGNETLTQMENIFGIKYSMPKLDFVAPPECFVAMENWGSIRFQEDSLLYKKDFSSEEIQQNHLLRLVVHEIVHMWFGNYVTTKWWDDIWLNEATAMFFTYHDAPPASLADWKMNNLFIQLYYSDALAMDGLVNSRPVIVPVQVPTWGTFDQIVYKKGSSLLNMVKHVFPKKDNFIVGLKKYLNKYKYGNAVGDEFWDILQSECSPVECGMFKEMMKTWMTETNYPVLTVKKSADGKYIVEQERFVYDKTAKVDKTLWNVKFLYIHHKDNKSLDANYQPQERWMMKDTKPLESADINWDGNGWIKGNPGQTGFYRVNYDDSNWASLAAQLNHFSKSFNEVDRFGLIDDAFNLVRGGRLGITRALSLTEYFDKEKSYLPWMAFQKNIGYILSILPEHSHTSHHLKSYSAYQSRDVYKDLGFTNSGSHLDKLIRMVAVGFQCDAGSRSCLGNMTEMFRKWKNDHLTTSIPPALRKFVYFYGVRQGTPEDWELVLKRLKSNTIASEYQPLLMGLAGTRDKWTLYKYLTLMGDPTIVKKQYVKYVLDYIANHNPDGSDVTWTFVQLNWERLKKPDPVSAMSKYLPTITKRFSTSYQLELLEKFINDNLNGQAMPRDLRKTIEIVKLNIAWRKTHENNLEKWLKDYIKSKNIPQDSSGSDFAEPA